MPDASKNQKKQLGQFNTTNKDYIFAGFERHIKDRKWTDPFAGEGDLLDWAKEHGAFHALGFDIDPIKQSARIAIRDTLKTPANYAGQWIITNPPYLARNKNKDKTLYDQYQLNDFYKIALETFQTSEGGLVIVPLNFLSAYSNAAVRDKFFSKFKITQCTTFEESVFDDTDYTVCSFFFERRDKDFQGQETVSVLFKPSGKTITYDISSKHHWILGQEFYEWIEDTSLENIGRWTVDNKNGGLPAESLQDGKCYVNDFKTIKDEKFAPHILQDSILIRSIDSGTENGKIRLENLKNFKTKDVHPILLGLDTSRNMAHVRLKNPPTQEQQEIIIKEVNDKLNYYREKYNSIFLAPYRNSTKNGSRKRMSFEDCYKLINKCRKEMGI